jgi:plastocyanin
MKTPGRIGALILVFVAAVAIVVTAGYGVARATTVTVEVGSDWYCDPSFENDDPNSYCTTTINVGDTVTWQRVQGTHDVVECGANWAKWDNSDEVCVGALFDSGNLNSTNLTWSRTFDTPGEFWYVCTRHFPDQKGKIVVQDVATPTPSPVTTPSPSSTTAPTLAPTGATSPTPSPTILPVALPPTGGALGSDGSVSWLAIVLAGAFAIVGGGAVMVGRVLVRIGRAEA